MLLGQSKAGLNVVGAGLAGLGLTEGLDCEMTCRCLVGAPIWRDLLKMVTAKNFRMLACGREAPLLGQDPNLVANSRSTDSTGVE